MTIKHILSVTAAIVPLALAGAGFLMMDGLGSAEAAGSEETVAIAQPAPVNPVCQSATWPNIPAECLEGISDTPRTVRFQ